MTHEELRVDSLGVLLKTLGELWDHEQNPKAPTHFRGRTSLWFRGHADASWQLTPVAGRKPFIDAAQAAGEFDVRAYTASAFREFERRCARFIDPRMGLAERYFLARHHDLPTFLLDWSSNPLVALWRAAFADPSTDGALHVLDARPGYEAQANPPYDSEWRGQNDAVIEQCLRYLLMPEDDGVCWPNAQNLSYLISPHVAHGRMMAQSAVFTLHHPESATLPDQWGSPKMRKWIVPASRKEKLCRELRHVGITKATLYPDLHHAVEEVSKDYFGANPAPQQAPEQRPTDP